ncbi:hypothetical protein [Nonomuraea sp. C10]|uniref:hypothetical protein n=1 Tax=Nonomuraea sp. C10 TaxID=2600577 RepID=UPI0011CE2494|nr:hypothetical protein [Nonomuraea sp. C10]TXK34789.1 hypothetical protein FR742_36350 [Nonomuraea sp. C10]
MTDRPRLDERAVAGRLELLEEMLNELETTSGPTAELALDAVATLAEVYGEALARVMDRAAAYPGFGSAAAGDVLLAHLFALHGVPTGQPPESDPGTAFIPLDTLARRPATSRAAP